MHLPKDVAPTTRVKAVVLIHGFGADKRENGLFLKLADVLSSQGFLVLAYDWRGLGRSTGNFGDTPLEIHARDLSDTVFWLSENYSVKPKETSLLGFSLGCALIGISFKNGLATGPSVFLSPAVRPALDMWPRYATWRNRIKLLLNWPIRKAGTSVELGRKLLHSLRETDLGPNAFDLANPLLVCHGTDDVRIPIETSRRCAEAASNRGLIFKEFLGASHSFRPAEQYHESLADTVCEWLSKYGTQKSAAAFQGSQARPTEVRHS